MGGVRFAREMPPQTRCLSAFGNATSAPLEELPSSAGATARPATAHGDHGDRNEPRSEGRVAWQEALVVASHSRGVVPGVFQHSRGVGAWRFFENLPMQVDMRRARRSIAHDGTRQRVTCGTAVSATHGNPAEGRSFGTLDLAAEQTP